MRWSNLVEPLKITYLTFSILFLVGVYKPISKMKKLLFFLSIIGLSLLNACSQPDIDPVTDTTKPPKTNCGGIECAGAT